MAQHAFFLSMISDHQVSKQASEPIGLDCTRQNMNPGLSDFGHSRSHSHQPGETCSKMFKGVPEHRWSGCLYIIKERVLRSSERIYCWRMMEFEKLTVLPCFFSQRIVPPHKGFDTRAQMLTESPPMQTKQISGIL